jgi:hypothetical protein
MLSQCSGQRYIRVVSIRIIVFSHAWVDDCEILSLPNPVERELRHCISLWGILWSKSYWRRGFWYRNLRCASLRIRNNRNKWIWRPCSSATQFQLARPSGCASNVSSSSDSRSQSSYPSKSSSDRTCEGLASRLWEGPTSNDDGGNTPVLERGNTPVLIQMFPQVLFWTVKRVHAINKKRCHLSWSKRD